MELSKTQQLLAYLSRSHVNASITVLIKLAYLVDLISYKKRKEQISDFKYVRYHYGPYDSQVNNEIEFLLKKEVVLASTEYSSVNDYVVYRFNEDKEVSFDALDEEEISLIDSVLEGLKGYGAKTLKDIAYKTAPMVKLGATQGGKENLGELLDMSA